MSCIKEINEKGDFLADPLDIMDEVIPRTLTRYNGGWIKKVDDLDKEHANGYSIVGDFCGNGVQWMPPGIYVDCSIGGSRRKWVRHYSLIKLNTDGTAKPLVEDFVGRDWAVNMWDAIQENLPEFKSKKDILIGEKEKLYNRIEEIEAELESIC